jgi:hypothetical protein
VAASFQDLKNAGRNCVLWVKNLGWQRFSWREVFPLADRRPSLSGTPPCAQVYCPPLSPIHKALWLPESGEPADLEAARIEFDRLPALVGRKILCSYAHHWRFSATREPKPQPAKEAADAGA